MQSSSTTKLDDRSYTGDHLLFVVAVLSQHNHARDDWFDQRHPIIPPSRSMDGTTDLLEVTLDPMKIYILITATCYPYEYCTHFIIIF